MKKTAKLRRQDARTLSGAAQRGSIRKAGGDARYFVPALEKGLDILEALAAARVPQSLTDLARSMNRTPSELFRMLNALERRAFIARDPVSEGYHLTLKLYELAHTHSPVDQLLKAARIPMDELAERIRESCHLSVLSRSMLLVIAQAESPDPVRLSVEVGDRVEPLRTASGRVLTAFLDSAEQENFLSANALWTEMTRKQRAELTHEMQQIRKDGYLLAPSTRRAGLDLSCIVGNVRTGVLAVLGVPFLPGSANDGRERQLVATVRSYADRITLALGLTPMQAGDQSHPPSGVSPC